jgi:hypothetical protein
MTDNKELEKLKSEIAGLYQQREQLKRDIENGSIPARQGLHDLEPIDRELSALDLHFKQLWDKQNK